MSQVDPPMPDIENADVLVHSSRTFRLGEKHFEEAKRLKLRNLPTQRAFQAWMRQIDRSGVKQIQIRQLLKRFGYRTRGPGGTAAKKIDAWFKCTEGIYIDNLMNLAKPLNDVAHLTFERVGPYYEPTDLSEVAFCRTYGDRLMEGLELHLLRSQYCPPGAADRFDFLGQDSQGNLVVVEVKRHDGGGKVVEQTMRYIGELQHAISRGLLVHEGGIRGVIVTNINDIPTQRALMGRQSDKHIQWWLYGLDRSRRLRMKHVSVPTLTEATERRQAS